MNKKKENDPSKEIQPKRLAVENEVMNDLQAYLSVSDIMDDIIEKGGWNIYLHYLRSKLPKHYSDFFTDIFQQLVVQEVRAYDPGESVETLLFYWNEEDEPEAPPLDSWCRLSLRINQPKSNSPKSQLIDSLGSLSESMSSMSSRMSRVGSAKRIKSGKKTPAKKVEEKEERLNKKLMREESEWQVQKTEEDAPPPEEDPLAERLRKEREDKKKQKAIEAEKKRKIQLEEKLREENAKNMEKQLRGKEYTFDFDGKVVLVHSPTTEGLPEEQLILNYNLKNPPKTLKSPPEKPEVIPDQVEEKKKVVPLPFTTHSKAEKAQPKKEEKKTDPTVAIVQPNLREVFQVKPGVKLKIAGIEKEGPEYKIPNRMKKSEYIQKLQDKDKERAEYYRNIAEKGFLDPVEEEKSSKGISKAHTMLSKQLERLSEINRLAEIQIHEQEKLIKMLMDDVIADPKALEEEQKRIEKAKAKLAKQKQEEEERKKALEIQNRIVNYVDDMLSAERKERKKEKAVGIHKLYDEYNKKILKDENWGQPGSSSHPDRVDLKSPKMSSEMKLQKKHSVFEGHILKEPRERGTVSQKKLRTVGEIDMKKSYTSLKGVASSQDLVLPNKPPIEFTANSTKQTFEKNPSKGLQHEKSKLSGSSPSSNKKVSDTLQSKKDYESGNSPSVSNKTRPLTSVPSQNQFKIRPLSKAK